MYMLGYEDIREVSSFTDGSDLVDACQIPKLIGASNREESSSRETAHYWHH